MHPHFSIRHREPLLALLLAVVFSAASPAPAQAQVVFPTPVPAPELEGGTAWINTGKPLKIKELRGKIVLLDFWTFCCINCMHIMPDLLKLEEKYKNELVVIGVHSGKFDNEKITENIRKAALRYELRQPSVNDADAKIWKAYGCEWWPTIAIIDPEGNIVAGSPGETNFSIKKTDAILASLVKKHRANKTLDETPLRFDTVKFRDGPDTPLYFPGKIVVDRKGQRLLIADSTHHRIIITDLNGKKIAIVGTGQPGNRDGAFEQAQFDDPQGMAVFGDTVYVADRKNNVIRWLDLKARTVRTVPGTTRYITVNNTPLAATPWDVWLEGPRLFVAMSGSHQIWVLDIKSGKFTLFAGDGDEKLQDGPRFSSKFAQPSGLTSDGKFLYVADCEASAIRRIPLDGIGPVQTLVGRGLFDFGDRDGPGQVADMNERKTKEAMLQHAVGVSYEDGMLYVADTCNSKIKTIEVATGLVTTLVGDSENKGPNRVFNEPTGLNVVDGKIYVADTNAHRIRVVDLKTKEVSTMELQDVPPVEPAKK